MSEFRRVAVFNKGKANEEVVVFNEGAPTAMQARVADLTAAVLLYIGGAGWFLAWLLTLIAMLAAAISLAANISMGLSLALGAVAITCAKPALVVSMKTTSDRGVEVAAWFGSAFLLAPCVLFSVLATAVFIGGQPFGAVLDRMDFNPARLVSGVAGFWIACIVELIATTAPAIILTAVKAMRAAYEMPPVPVAAAAPAARALPSVDSFEAGFSQWASMIRADISGRLSSRVAFQHYKDWAAYNGPYVIPTQEIFGRTLADHCRALGARPGVSNGYTVYQGVSIPAALPPPKLPAIA